MSSVPEIQFYHLTTTSQERALPKLVEKAYQAGQPTWVIAESRDACAALSNVLWTYDPDSFLPHGTMQEAHPELQPVFISTRDYPCPNQASVLLVTDSQSFPTHPTIRRVIDLFDGTNEENVAQARIRWTQYKQAGHTLTYIKQNEAGAWEKQSL